MMMMCGAGTLDFFLSIFWFTSMNKIIFEIRIVVFKRKKQYEWNVQFLIEVCSCFRLNVSAYFSDLYYRIIALFLYSRKNTHGRKLQYHRVFAKNIFLSDTKILSCKLICK